MNIFLILLMSVFMVGYYMFFAPNTRVPEQETDYAISVSDLRSVAECMIATHNAQIAGDVFDDICVQQHEIKSTPVCLNARLVTMPCDNSPGAKPPTFSFYVTTSGTLNSSDYNEMMEILEKNFATSGAIGIFQDGMIVSGGTSAKRTVPQSIQDDLDLQDGQLIYMTQYDRPDTARFFSDVPDDTLTCPAGATKTYRFGRWQCIGANIKTSCGGDMIWNADMMECVPDETRKPLCSGQQTAIIVDNVWECTAPFGERQCPNNMVARLNYSTLEWECVEDANVARTSSKCANLSTHTVRGRGGATLRVATTACTDCEIQIVDQDTCVTTCIPDPTKITSSACYPGNSRECTGASRAFYFGFPNATYVSNIPEIAGAMVPFDSLHSQNRRFNCLDCGAGRIDTLLSRPPYIAVCTQN